jgi:hypothetical protein
MTILVIVITFSSSEAAVAVITLTMVSWAHWKHIGPEGSAVQILDPLTPAHSLPPLFPAGVAVAQFAPDGDLHALLLRKRAPRSRTGRKTLPIGVFVVGAHSAFLQRASSSAWLQPR